MGKFNKIQAAFKAGEVSDKFKGRVDLQEYHQGCETLENFLTQRQGGVLKRPGSRFVVEEELRIDSKLVPFVYSRNESYVGSIAHTLDQVNITFYSTDQGTVAASPSSDVQLLTKRATDTTKILWSHAQKGDVLLLCPFSEDEPGDLGFRDGPEFYIDKRIRGPFIIARTAEDTFVGGQIGAEDTVAALPEQFGINPAAWVPYKNPNLSDEFSMYVDNVALGTGRTLSCVDSSSNPKPFFTPGHMGYGSDDTPAFFKITKGAHTGVFRCTTSANANPEVSLLYSKAMDASVQTLAQHQVIITGHGFQTGEQVLFRYSGTGPDGTDIFDDPTGDADAPTLTGELGVGDYSGNVFFGKAFVNRIDANTVAFYATADKAVAAVSTNAYLVNKQYSTLYFLEGMLMSSIGGVVEVAMEGTLTSAGAASDDWQESAWSKEQGFPRAVTFHEQRADYGGTYRQPDTIWISETGNLVNMMQNQLEQHTTFALARDTSTNQLPYPFVLFAITPAKDPTNFVISSRQTNIIQWFESRDSSLAIGTTGAEYIANGGDFPLSAATVAVRKQTAYGSSSAQAITVGDSVIFVGRPGRILRDFKYNRNNGSFVSTNLNTVSDHIVFRGFAGLASSTLKGLKIEEIVYSASSETIWCRTSGDKVIALALSKEGEVVAWSYLPFSFDVKGICVVPSSDGLYDEVWVARPGFVTSLGGSNIYLERILDNFEHTFLDNTSTDENDEPVFSDSALKITLSTTTDTVALPINAGRDVLGNGDNDPVQSHLEGETVNVLIGEVVDKGLVVASNSITLSATYPSGTVLYVGLPYAAKLTTLDIEAGGDFGTSQGNRQRVDRVSARLYRSQGGTYGNKTATKVPFEYDDTEVFTGIKRLDFDISPDMDVQVEIEHDDPTPFGVMSLTYRGVSYD